MSSPSTITVNHPFDVLARVTDFNGSPSPNRQVGLISDPVEIAVIETTDSDGIVTFSDLSISTPGVYTLTVVEQAGATDSVQITVTSPTAPPGTSPGAPGPGLGDTGFVQMSERSGQSVGFFQILAWIIIAIFITGAIQGATHNSRLALALGIPASVIIGVVFGVMGVWVLQTMILAGGAIWVYGGSRPSGGGPDPVKIIVVWSIFFIFTSMLLAAGVADVPQVPLIERPTSRGGLMGAVDILVGIINVLWVGVAFLFHVFTFNIGGTPFYIRAIITALTTPSLFWAIARLIRGGG
jgi:hypothetical protein